MRRNVASPDGKDFGVGLSGLPGLVPELRAEGIAMVDRSSDLSDYSLPETETDGHLTLLLATYLAKALRRKNSSPVPITRLEKETARLARENPQWRKDARLRGAEKSLTADALKRLAALGLLRLQRESGACVIPLPAIGRFGLRDPAPKPEKDLF